MVAHQEARILSIDDTTETQTILKLIFLRQWGCELLTASDGYQGLEVLKQDPLPHVVLLNINMPYINGYHVLQRLRADSRYDAMPILMHTVGSNYRDECLKAGADDFLLKPLYPQKLLNVVSHYFQHGRGTPYVEPEA